MLVAIHAESQAQRFLLPFVGDGEYSVALVAVFILQIFHIYTRCDNLVIARAGDEIAFPAVLRAQVVVGAVSFQDFVVDGTGVCSGVQFPNSADGFCNGIERQCG